jgi:hypothetical protein
MVVLFRLNLLVVSGVVVSGVGVVVGYGVVDGDSVVVRVGAVVDGAVVLNLMRSRIFWPRRFLASTPFKGIIEYPLTLNGLFGFNKVIK